MAMNQSQSSNNNQELKEAEPASSYSQEDSQSHSEQPWYEEGYQEGSRDGTTRKTSTSVVSTFETKKTDPCTSLPQHDIHPLFSPEDYNETVTFDTMLYDHVIQKKACIALVVCSSIVFGIKKCSPTRALMFFLNYVCTKSAGIFSQDTPPLNVADNKCLSCHKAIVLGAYPFNDIHWQLTTTETTEAAYCLLSYFAQLCKVRALTLQKCYELLKFTNDAPAGNDHNRVRQQLVEVYKEFLSLRDGLHTPTDVRKTVQDLISTGLGIVNIFHFSDKKAAQDFLPYFNHYSQHAINVACFDSSLSNDAETQSQFLKQLNGLRKNRTVALLATDDDGAANTQPLVESLSRTASVNVHIVKEMSISLKTVDEVKQDLEKSVLGSPFYEEVPLAFLFLLLNIKRCQSSFWMEKKEVEDYAKFYNLENVQLDTFLQLFTKIGSILYFHDMPALRKYVIVDVVEFVEAIHKLYQSSEAEHGLIKQKHDDKDQQLVLDILTTIGLGAKVKFSQIESVSVKTTYYIIPPAMKNISATDHDGSSDAIELFRLKGFARENLLACLCTYLLQQCPSSCLIPKKLSMNTLSIDLTTKEEIGFVVEFIDTGNKLMVRSLNTDVITASKRNRLAELILKNNSSNRELERQVLINAIYKPHEEGKVDHKKMIMISHQLAKLSSEKQIDLANKLGFTKKQLHDEIKEVGRKDAILLMILEYVQNNSTEDLNAILQELKPSPFY